MNLMALLLQEVADCPHRPHQPIATRNLIPQAVSDFGIVLSDSGHLPCVFNNLVGLLFKKMCHLKSQVPHPAAQSGLGDGEGARPSEGAGTRLKLSGHDSQATIAALWERITFCLSCVFKN